MALTATIQSVSRAGKHKHVIGTLAFDNSYPTNGESYSGVVNNVLNMTIPPFGGYSFAVDYTNKKIKVYALTVTGGAAAAGTDTLICKSSVLSKQEATDYTMPLGEAVNTKDLSALTAVPFSAWCRK